MPRRVEPPAPAQFRVPVILEQLPSGRIRLSTPVLPDWHRAAQGSQQIARAVHDLINAAVTEAQIRQYRARRHAIKHAIHNDRRATTGASYQRFVGPDGRTVRRVGHNPHSWTEQPDGSWRSPSGRTYRKDSQVVARVKARQALTPNPADPPPPAPLTGSA